MHTFETSAKTGQNVDNAFSCLIYQVIKPCIAVREQWIFDARQGDTRLQIAAWQSVQNPL